MHQFKKKYIYRLQITIKIIFCFILKAMSTFIIEDKLFQFIIKLLLENKNLCTFRMKFIDPQLRKWIQMKIILNFLIILKIIIMGKKMTQAIKINIINSTVARNNQAKITTIISNKNVSIHQFIIIIILSLHFIARLSILSNPCIEHIIVYNKNYKKIMIHL